MLIFAGVGPGDPELLTLKAARALERADAIALADSGRGESVVQKIAGTYMAQKPVYRLHMPMTGNRADWRAAHEQAARELLELLKVHPTIVYPVLGDPGIYASSSYLADLLRPHHPVKVIPGIPTMCAAAAEMGVALCEQRETLTVVDQIQADEPLPAGNAVIMKCGKSLAALQQKAAHRQAYAIRNLGLEDQWVGALEDAPTGNPSYFTTVILKGEKK